MLSLAERAANRRAERIELILGKKKKNQIHKSKCANTGDSSLRSSTTWKENEQLLIDRLHKLNEDDFHPPWAEAIAQYKKQIELGPLTHRAITGRLQAGLKTMLDFFEYAEKKETTKKGVKTDDTKLKRSASVEEKQTSICSLQRNLTYMRNR